MSVLGVPAGPWVLARGGTPLVRTLVQLEVYRGHTKPCIYTRQDERFCRLLIRSVGQQVVQGPACGVACPLQPAREPELPGKPLIEVELSEEPRHRNLPIVRGQRPKRPLGCRKPLRTPPEVEGVFDPQCRRFPWPPGVTVVLVYELRPTPRKPHGP